jgi:hypothetical protein
MPIEFSCHQCGRQLRTADDTAGKMARCPACGNVQVVPGLGAAPAEPKPASGDLYSFSDADASSAASPFGTASKLNPFADSAASTNPYAAPQFPGAFQAPFRDAAYAQARVQGPAMALLVTFGLMLAVSVTALVIFLVALATGNNNEPEALLQFAFSIPMSGLVVYGANKMRRLENYGMAVAAAVLAMIPCGGCCVLGLPFGIWALVVLNDPSVKAAFH